MRVPAVWSVSVLIRCAPYLWSILFGVLATVAVCAVVLIVDATVSSVPFNQTKFTLIAPGVQKEIDAKVEAVTTRIGFPMHVYETRRDIIETMGEWRVLLQVRGQPPFTPRPGPSQILWGGVAFNALFYGSPVLVVCAWRRKQLPGRRIAVVVSGGLLVSLATVGVQLVPGMPRIPVLTDARARSVGLPFRTVQMDTYPKGGRFADRRSPVVRWLDPMWVSSQDRSWAGLGRAAHFAQAPAVIGNWVFWSAVLGVGIFVPSAIVSRRRRAKGQCLKCGYAMAAGGLDRCPECGAGARRPC